MKDNTEALKALARMTLWIAFNWNDHNFDKHPYKYARECAASLDINNLKEANEFLSQSLTQSVEVVDVSDIFKDIETYAGTSPHQDPMFIEHTKRFLNCHPDDDRTAWAWLCYMVKTHLTEIYPNGIRIKK